MNLKKLKTSKLEEVRNEIKRINEQNIAYGTYEGRIDDEAAKSEYQELLDSLMEIPGLSVDDIVVLQQEIQQRMNTIGKYKHSVYNLDNIIDEETFRKAVERVHYQHRYDAGAMFGTLSPNEAERDYNILLILLDDVIGLSDNFKEEMRGLIQQKIDNIPAVQQEKIEEYKTYQAEHKKAFEEAKERFNKLGLFQKLKLKKQGKAPEQLNAEDLGIDQVNALYRK